MSDQEKDKTLGEMREKYGISVGKYIWEENGEYSICREERQYVVLLYNILRKYRRWEDRKDREDVKKIFRACGLDDNDTVEYVFYEAAFMRDFFERNRRIILSSNKDDVQMNQIEDIIRRTLLNKTFSPPGKSYLLSRQEWSFNCELMKYICKEERCPESCFVEERNWGHNEIDCGLWQMLGEDKRKAVVAEIRHMMNAKPDLAVIYSDNGTDLNRRYLLFLECKFEYGETKYEGESQTDMQGKIAEFMCKKWWKDKDIELSPGMFDVEKEEGKDSKPKSRLVKFTRKENEENNDIIFIGNLIKIDSEIFAF